MNDPRRPPKLIGVVVFAELECQFYHDGLDSDRESSPIGHRFSHPDR